MSDSLFMSLHELGHQLTDTALRTPLRATLVKRGRKFADANGLRIYSVDGHSFVNRAELAALLDVAA